MTAFLKGAMTDGKQGPVVEGKHAASNDSAGKSRRQYILAPERRRGILATAREVFVRVGPEGARTRELAKMAGVNEATIFKHFPNKQALFLAAVIEPLQEAMKNARERSEVFQKARGAARKALGLASARQTLASAEELYPMLAMGLFADRETGRKLYCDHVYPMLRERGEAIQDAVREGVDGEFLSIVIFGIALAISTDCALRDVPMDVEYLARQMSNILQNGAVSDDKRTDEDH
jgi:AcrR family transcriptional regulator